MSEENTSKLNYENYKAHGICVSCGVEKAAPHRVRCEMCLIKDIERQEKRRREKAEYFERRNQTKYTTMWTREHRKSQKAKGLCIYCNNPLSPYSKCFCVDHRIKNQRKNEMRKDGIDRAERPFYGLCYRCAEKVEQGQKLCSRCRSTSIKNLSKIQKSAKDKSNYSVWKADNAIALGKRKI